MRINHVESTATSSLFNKVSMGYVIVESARLREWKTFLEDGVGMHVDASSDVLRVRIDEHLCRFIIKSGSAEDVVSLGLEVTDGAALSEVLRRVKQANLPLREQIGADAHLRGVDQFWSFPGPKGIQIECFTNPHSTKERPQMRCKGFVTGDQGFGHVAMVTQRPNEVFAYLQRIFDIRHSDDVVEVRSGAKLHFKFLRFNRRHHSIALASTPGIRLNPIRTSIQHMEVQMVDMDEVARAYERCKKIGSPIAMGIGQHANDRALSFYVRTPSGFDIECGWQPLTVNEETWSGEVWDTSSIWGHRPENNAVKDFLYRLMRAIRSVWNREDNPLLGAK